MKIEEYQNKIINMIKGINNLNALKSIYRIVHKYFIHKWARPNLAFLFILNYENTFQIIDYYISFFFR